MSNAAQPILQPALSSPAESSGTSPAAVDRARLRLPMGSNAPLISGVLLLACAVLLLLTRVGLGAHTVGSVGLQRFAVGTWSVWGSLSWASGFELRLTLVSCIVGVVALLGLLTLAGVKWPQTHRVVCLVAGLGLLGLGVWLFPFFLLAGYAGYSTHQRPFGQAMGLAIATAGVPAFAVAVVLCLTSIGAGVCLLVGTFGSRPARTQMVTRTTAASLLAVAIILGVIVALMVGGRLGQRRFGVGGYPSTWYLLGCLPMIVFLVAAGVLVLGLSADAAKAYYEPPARPVRAAPATTPGLVAQPVPTYVMVTLADGTQQMMPVAQTASVAANPAGAPDHSSGGFAVLGFFFPVVGLILYLVWKAQTPLKARSAGKGALIGVIVYVALVILLVILTMILAASLS